MHSQKFRSSSSTSNLLHSQQSDESCARTQHAVLAESGIKGPQSSQSLVWYAAALGLSI